MAIRTALKRAIRKARTQSTEEVCEAALNAAYALASECDDRTDQASVNLFLESLGENLDRLWGVR